MPKDRYISPLPTLTTPSETWAVGVCCHLRFPHCDSHFKKYIATPSIFNQSQNTTCMFEVASRCLTTVWRKLSAAHFGRTLNCNSMLVELKYKIQMFNNKRKQNTNDQKQKKTRYKCRLPNLVVHTSMTWPPVILSPTPAETAERSQHTHMGRTTEIQRRGWSFAKWILFEQKAESTVNEHSSSVPHSDLRTACFCVSQSTQPTQFSSVSKNGASKMVDSMGMLVNCNGASWAGLSGQAGHWSCLEFGTDAFDA